MSKIPLSLSSSPPSMERFVCTACTNRSNWLRAGGVRRTAANKDDIAFLAVLRSLTSSLQYFLNPHARSWRPRRAGRPSLSLRSLTIVRSLCKLCGNRATNSTANFSSAMRYASMLHRSSSNTWSNPRSVRALAPSIACCRYRSAWSPPAVRTRQACLSDLASKHQTNIHELNYLDCLNY